MKNSVQAKIMASASVELSDGQARVEKLAAGVDGQELIRLSAWRNNQILSKPLMLSEKELIELLHEATHAGVLSRDLVGKLRERIEI
jgi:hypothetical protein